MANKYLKRRFTLREKILLVVLLVVLLVGLYFGLVFYPIQSRSSKKSSCRWTLQRRSKSNTTA